MSSFSKRPIEIIISGYLDSAWLWEPRYGVKVGKTSKNSLLLNLCSFYVAVKLHTKKVSRRVLEPRSVHECFRLWALKSSRLWFPWFLKCFGNFFAWFQRPGKNHGFIKMAGKAQPKLKDSMTSLSRTPQRFHEVVAWNEAFVWIFSSQGGLGIWDDSENNLVLNSLRFREEARPTWHSARQKKQKNKKQKYSLGTKEVSKKR